MSDIYKWDPFKYQKIEVSVGDALNFYSISSCYQILFYFFIKWNKIIIISRKIYVCNIMACTSFPNPDSLEARIRMRQMLLFEQKQKLF